MKLRSPEIMNKIIEGIDAHKTFMEIGLDINLSPSTVGDYIKSLNNPESNLYNPAIYEKVKAKIEKDSEEKKKEYHRRGETSEGQVKFMIYDALINNARMRDLTQNNNLTTYNLFTNFKRYATPEEVIKLCQIFPEFDLFLNSPSSEDIKKFKLYNTNKETIKEVYLLCLTYRVSYDSLAKIIGASSEDVRFSLRNLFAIESDSLYHLEIEIQTEDEINQKVAYAKAKNYWIKRQKLMKSLKEAKKNGNSELVVSIKEEIKLLRQEIDDSIVFGTIGKKYSDLSEIELKKIVYYRLKYGLSVIAAAEILGRNKTTINNLEELEAEKNPIFAEKIEILKTFFQEVHNDRARSGRGME